MKLPWVHGFRKRMLHSAFGKLKGYVFASKDISLPAKRAAYVALVLSIL
jgi:hypothetical protein